MYLIFLGPPGAGKGTQAERLGQDLGLPRISTGDMLRQAVARGTELGRKAERYMNAGDLVPDEVVIGIVEDRLSDTDTAAGFILDGYPRTASQAAALDSTMAGRGMDLDMVIYLSTSEEEIVARLSGRRVCPGCGSTYHVRFDPPRRQGTCDDCGLALEQRADDNEKTVRERLDVYRRLTNPLLEYYRGRGLIREVDGQGSPQEVYQRLQIATGDET